MIVQLAKTSGLHDMDIRNIIRYGLALVMICTVYDTHLSVQQEDRRIMHIGPNLAEAPCYFDIRPSSSYCTFSSLSRMHSQYHVLPILPKHLPTLHILLHP